MNGVLHVYKDFFPVVGGIENHVKLLCSGLAKESDLDVSVLVTNTGRQTVREVFDGIKVTKVGRIATLASAPLSIGLFWEIGRQSYDVIHLHFPYPIGELAYLFRGRTKRMVITYHSDIVRQRNLLRVYSPFLWRVLHRADRLILSNPSYATTSRYLPQVIDKCTVIPFGIEPSQYLLTPEGMAKVAEIRRKQAADGRPLLLFVGMLRYYKGLQYLIEAMRDIPAKLMVVGKGPMESQLREQVAELNIADKVVFLGRVSDEELVPLYHASDIFVLPSSHRSEAFGIVQLEAMACGLPVICTELGTGTSFVNKHGETGLVVPPSDAVRLSEAIRQLLANPAQRQEMGRRGRERVERELCASVMVQKTLALYRELLGD